MWTRVRRRYRAARRGWPELRLKPASALRGILAEGYHLADLRADLLAGTVVGIVALPLSMALAIASGVPPQHGLYTAMVGGFVIALLGGSRWQVSGPTAAFVVILAPIAHAHGLGGLLVAGVMAGLLLIGLGVARLGRLIQFIPHPVTTGFTAGIAVVIATLQLSDLLGLATGRLPEAFLEKVVVIARALPGFRWPDLGIGGLTMAALLLWPRLRTRVPAALVALPLGALVAAVLLRVEPTLGVDTIATRFTYLADGVVQAGIPRLPPIPGWPWRLPGPDGQPLQLTLELLRGLMPAAFAIAMLGAIESLLSAVVADGMKGTRHDPDSELIAQGVGNLLTPFFGGIAATGAIARTATSVRAGARSPLAAAWHALFVLAAVLSLAPMLGYLPMASLAALLLLVAWNMSEQKHFRHVLAVAPRGDALVLLTCFGLTVVFDMVVAVTAGVLLAALLFMRRMAELADTRLVEDHPALRGPVPPGILLYRVAGPLFFGAAQRAMEALHESADGARVVVLDLSAVPIIDATGMVNLESTLARLQADNTLVILCAVADQPSRFLRRAGVVAAPGLLEFAESVPAAMVLATTHMAHPEPAA